MNTYSSTKDLFARMKVEFDNLKIPSPQVFSKCFFRTWLLLRFFLPRNWSAGVLMESEPQRNHEHRQNEFMGWRARENVEHSLSSH